MLIRTPVLRLLFTADRPTVDRKCLPWHCQLHDLPTMSPDRYRLYYSYNQTNASLCGVLSICVGATPTWLSVMSDDWICRKVAFVSRFLEAHHKVEQFDLLCKLMVRGGTKWSMKIFLGYLLDCGLKLVWIPVVN